MSKIMIPEGYRMPLTNNQLQRAIEFIHADFQKNLTERLDLHRVSAPLFVDGATGLNDDLNGVERPVTFDIPDVGTDGQVVHSLAKWKRLALKRYEFQPGTGLYTNMNAIRRDEEVDNLHSVYVDQWDWEKNIRREDRNLQYLKDTVRTIVSCICDTAEGLRKVYPVLTFRPDRDVYFITSQELEDLYPDLAPNEREKAVCQKHRTVFLMQIGGKLRSGKPHDGRAPDYDDWTLNGDILMWNPVLQRNFEVSSMGIRVDEAALDRQLTLSGHDERRALPFHKMLLDGQLPQSIGGGIGQSRLCMLLLGACHIGEVQASLWDAETAAVCEKAGITLL
ncbi:aspartate--ammonia ligase [uncultured Oscillibacter sp.]|uniref:aspartate--ammonia ligase n=1 Tax=uncultured Oscillibacter sp. TaxID=876091 RepID=UPI0025E575E5|nr:aspartate--ammonia ligase [uncultured Oscillibacter sp.]